MTNETITFKVGETYATRSACNHDCIFSYTVVRRTAKFIFIDKGRGEIERRGVTVWDGVETCKPEGTYSMCPFIDARGSLVRPDGEITSEFENRTRTSPEWERINAEREAAGQAPVQPVGTSTERKPDPQLEGIGCNADETPIAFANHSAETVVKVLIENGFTPETLRTFSTDRIIREFEAILRRTCFHVVAA